MITSNTKSGSRVELLGMRGTFLGMAEIKRTAKNYCDGFSSIQLEPVNVALIKWDEAPFPVSANSSEMLAISLLTDAV